MPTLEGVSVAHRSAALPFVTTPGASAVRPISSTCGAKIPRLSPRRAMAGIGITASRGSLRSRWGVPTGQARSQGGEAQLELLFAGDLPEFVENSTGERKFCWRQAG